MLPTAKHNFLNPLNFGKSRLIANALPHPIYCSRSDNCRICDCTIPVNTDDGNAAAFLLGHVQSVLHPKHSPLLPILVSIPNPVVVTIAMPIFSKLHVTHKD